MASIVSNLQKELDCLQARIIHMQKQADGIKATIAYLQEKNGTVPSVAPSQLPSGSGRPKKQSKNEPSQWIKEIVEIFKAHDEPMHRRFIYEALTERGIHVPGNDPMHNLGAHLSLNKDLFKSVGNGYWELVKHPVTPNNSLDDAEIEFLRNREKSLARQS